MTKPNSGSMTTWLPISSSGQVTAAASSTPSAAPIMPDSTCSVERWRRFRSVAATERTVSRATTPPST